jgi:hypothetical protein
MSNAEFRAKVKKLTVIPYRRIPFASVGELKKYHYDRKAVDKPLRRLISHQAIAVMTVDGRYYRLFEEEIPDGIFVDFPAEIAELFQ